MAYGIVRVGSGNIFGGVLQVQEFFCKCLDSYVSNLLTRHSLSRWWARWILDCKVLLNSSFNHCTWMMLLNEHIVQCDSPNVRIPLEISRTHVKLSWSGLWWAAWPMLAWKHYEYDAAHHTAPLNLHPLWPRPLNYAHYSHISSWCDRILCSTGNKRAEQHGNCDGGTLDTELGGFNYCFSQWI